MNQRRRVGRRCVGAASSANGAGAVREVGVLDIESTSFVVFGEVGLQSYSRVVVQLVWINGVFRPFFPLKAGCWGIVQETRWAGFNRYFLFNFLICMFFINSRERRFLNWPVVQ
jgi:hypothetical protein